MHDICGNRTHYYRWCSYFSHETSLPGITRSCTMLCLRKAGALKYNPFLTSLLYNPDGLRDLNDSFGGKGFHLRWRTDRRVIIDSLLAEVFLSCKVNVSKSVHSPRYHLIITLIISRQSSLTRQVSGDQLKGKFRFGPEIRLDGVAGSMSPLRTGDPSLHPGWGEKFCFKLIGLNIKKNMRKLNGNARRSEVYAKTDTYRIAEEWTE